MEPALTKVRSECICWRSVASREQQCIVAHSLCADSVNETAPLYLKAYRKAALTSELGVFSIPIEAVGLEILEEPNEFCIARPAAAAEEIPTPKKQGCGSTGSEDVLHRQIGCL